MTAPTHLVFVDFENVPTVDLGAIAGRPVKVTLLIGKQQKKLDLALVQQIHRLAAQVELIEVGGSGRNALDLTLACYLGKSVEASPNVQFHIVSKDKDFDPLIAHLKASGVKVSRHATLGSVPMAGTPAKPPATSAKSAPEARLARFIEALKNPNRTDRPARRRTLVKHLKSQLGGTTSDEQAEAIITNLCAEGMLKITAGDKVEYPAP
jgi:hypothetical protein